MWGKSRFTIPVVVAIGFCFIGGTSPAAADILHVPGDFLTIQEAIDAALDGDEVEVHPGTYFETINLLGKAIRVYSTDGPNMTIIDAQQMSTVVTCNNGEGPDTALDGFTVTGGEPSGMRNVGSSPTVNNCTFSTNTADSGGGDGGGMFNCCGSSPTVTNCTFIENSAEDRGGGMSNCCGSSPTVTNCTFSGNTVSEFHHGGGGMYNGNSSPTVTNCTFSGNTANGAGGGMFNEADSSPTVTNCTFSSNSASNGNALAFDFGPSELTMANCILWDGGNEIWNNDGSTITIGYTNVQGGWEGVGNIDADPMFVDPGIGDYRLLSGSPAIDAGNNWGVPVDANDYDEDGISCELFPVDLDGNPRFNADESDFDPGCGIPVVVDMGAYEYQFDPVEQITFADLTGDGAVSTLDLLSLFAEWGPCAKGCCLADLDLDGFVNTIDLLLLFANWGACK